MPKISLRQNYIKLRDAEKNKKLFEPLHVLEFSQVVIFVKSAQRCIALAQLLVVVASPTQSVVTEAVRPGRRPSKKGKGTNTRYNQYETGENLD